jgi:lysophospholipase L1-like esterase
MFAALLVLTSGGAPAAAQEWVLRAFGDSITEGYGDTTTFNGYAARLERRLVQAGYDAVVTEHGVGGETTAEGLSRIDEVLALGGDILLLMEGTNDISQHVGVESIKFNLDEMAARAEAAGFSAVHGTVIPRWPEALVDANNAKTSLLATRILQLGAERARVVADVFHEFEALPNLFEDFYYHEGSEPDPVGHPNWTGYVVIAGVFFEAVQPLLEGPQIQIVPPAGGPFAPGELLDFGVEASETIAFVEWDFGDGGYALTRRPDPLGTPYSYAAPGAYDVVAVGWTLAGESVSDFAGVVVTGAPINWNLRTLLVPAAEEVAGGPTTDLLLANAGSSHALAEVEFLPDIAYDDPPPARRFLIPIGGTSIPRVLATAFEAPGGRGAFRVVLGLPFDANNADATTLLRALEDEDGADGCETSSLSSNGWNSSPKQTPPIFLTSAETTTIHVTNLDEVPGSVRMDLFDAVGGYVGSALFDLDAGLSRQRELRDLFRPLPVLPQPFVAHFVSSGIRYSAAVVVAGAGEVRCANSFP